VALSFNYSTLLGAIYSNAFIIIIIIFNYAIAAPVRVYAAGLYRYIIYIRGKPYRAG
jgi:hypothetical protein